MKVREVIRLLERDGWQLAVTRGSHRQFTHPSKPARVEGGQVVRKLRYLVRINKDRSSDWGASVPDLPGCVATGKTIDAALRRIQGAIELHLEGMRYDGMKPPRPRRRVVVPRRTSRQVDFYATVEVAA
ncbi:MAG TPA: type II toxin-antitoxin system HicB family antitoxin [Candidatus Polarisedimenticolia bacterium]